MEERKQKEIEFHNKRELLRFTDAAAYREITQNKKFYSITRKSNHYLDGWFRKACPGKMFLDYCCGTGSFALRAASYGATVAGIDISDESIRTCTVLARENKLDDRASFFVMDAENLGFRDDSFDSIFCGGVLHHLDTNKAFLELSRLLQPTGEILCVEALGYNPLINWYRKRTPHMRTEWEKDHILTLEDIHIARNYFHEVELRFFHLASLAAVPFRTYSFFSPLLSFLEGIDAVLLRLPFIQRQAWQMAFKLSKPRKVIAA